MGSTEIINNNVERLYPYKIPFLKFDDPIFLLNKCNSVLILFIEILINSLMFFGTFRNSSNDIK